MKSYHANLGAGIDGLVVREHDVPEPGHGQVLVRVRASSLSYRELMILRGWYPLPIRPDVVPISDGAAGLPPLDPRVLWMSGADVRTIAVGTRAHFEALNRAIEAHAIEPVSTASSGSRRRSRRTATTRPPSPSARS